MPASGSIGVGRSLAIVLLVCLVGSVVAVSAATATTQPAGPASGSAAVSGTADVSATPTESGLSIPAETTNETLVVDADGDGNYTSIQPAVDNATAGDTVEVMPGSYDENVVVDKNVTVVAPYGAAMERETANELKAAFQITVSGNPEPTIRGFTIRNYNIGVGGAQGEAAWVIEDLHISVTGHAGVFAAESAGDWRATNVTTVGGKHGFDTQSSTSDWLIEDSTITESNSNGIFADDSEGNWTIRNTTIAPNSAGVAADRSQGAWAVEGSNVTDTGGPGVEAVNSSGSWTITDTSIRGSNGHGIDAVQADGDWTIENATIEANDAGAVAAGDTAGAWTVADSTVGQGAFFGVTAVRSTGDWSITGTTIRNRTGVAVFAENADGDWSVLDTTIRNIRTQTTAELPSEGVGVFANRTTGAWTVDNTSITATERPGINATNADVRGDATGNWWGQLTGATPEDCVGNVTCEDHRTSPPGGPAGDTPEDYANEDGVVETVGVRVAVEDWQNGHVESTLLVELLEAWSSGAQLD